MQTLSATCPHQTTAMAGGGCRRGFQFVEVLISVVLITVLFIVGMAVSQSLVGVKKVYDYEIAISLANQAVEAMRAARFREVGSDKDGRRDTLVNDFGTAANPFDQGLGERFVPQFDIKGVKYEREVSVTDVPSKQPGQPSYLKLARVRVRWKAPESGEALVYEVVTTLADNW